MQLIFAGKAHPQDQAGKELIKFITHFIATQRLRHQVVFIEDYDFNVARYLVQGVDVWLNTPLRPLEACGTSGMKAACNGVLNFSVLDGWWDEAYDFRNGWAIGNRETYTDRDYQDEVESKAIYSILENDIAPLFYTRGSDGLPREWIRMIKYSMLSIASRFNTSRMLKEYFDSFYKPAAQNGSRLAEQGFAALKEFNRWQERLRRDFAAIQIREVQFDGRRVFRIGETVEVRAEVDLGRSHPEDIHVDAYYGVLGSSGEQLQHSGLETLSTVEKINDGRYRFSGCIPCRQTGNFGLRIRITPYHPFLVHPYELNLVLWG